jgi:hypothetical protein
MWLAICSVGVITGLLLTDLAMTMKLSREIQDLRPEPQPRRSLPCESVPLHWAVNNYDCTNSLLWAMNVTNVKFLPPSSPHINGYNRSPG